MYIDNALLSPEYIEFMVIKSITANSIVIHRRIFRGNVKLNNY